MGVERNKRRHDRLPRVRKIRWESTHLSTRSKLSKEKKRKEVKVRQRYTLTPDVCQQSCKIIQLRRDRGVLLQVLSQILIRSSKHSMA